jgi:hypothetical protein
MHRALKQKEGWVQGRDELLCGIILNDFSPALCRQQIDGRNAWIATSAACNPS